MFFARKRAEQVDTQLYRITRLLKSKAIREMHEGNDCAPITFQLSFSDFNYLVGYLESVTDIDGANR